MLHRDPASFRDPDGFVFRLGETLYRSVTPSARARLIDSQDFFRAAVERGYLLPFEVDAELPEFPAASGRHVIKPENVDLITYPYEWCFEQLKDAALNTLDINIMALGHGLTLKDASAFNVQMHRGAPRFIDHTSFEPTDGRLPWRPYSQFCRHFLNPLVIGAYLDIHAGAFFRMNLDGVPQQTANALLPWRARFVPSIAMHMLLHNRFIQRSSEFEARKARPKSVSRASQLELLNQLRSFIGSLEPARAVSNWANYYSQTNYDDATFARKKEIVATLFRDRRLGTVWDLGANDGSFSRLVAPSADRVLALDLDHNAVDACYHQAHGHAEPTVYALVYDVCNPTPSLGFENAERSALELRSKPDAILALALIHHLSITSNIPFDQSANYFAARSKELVIEFVGPADSQVKRLLAQKNTSYQWYNKESFEASFSKRFRVDWREEIPGTDRSFYHLERRT